MNIMDVIKAILVSTISNSNSSLLSLIAKTDVAGAEDGIGQLPAITIHTRGITSFESTSSRKGTGSIMEKALLKLLEVRRSKVQLEAKTKRCGHRFMRKNDSSAKILS
jgi:hypothetical protein